MFKKILLGIISLLILAIVILVVYVQLNWNKVYDIPYPDLKVSTDSAVIAKGKYLVHGPAHCSNCHVSSIEDMIATDRGDPIPLKGGAPFPMEGLGVLYVPNLTPDPTTGIGRFSDGQIFRMMRHAVRPSGISSIALLMPFWNMADEDLIAVVSYLRSMEPVQNEVQPAQWTFMGKVVRTIFIKPVEDPTPPATAPPMEATIERGAYLARYVANCAGCHTPFDFATLQPTGPEFSGGTEFEPIPELHLALGEDPELWVRSPNITPHPNGALAKFKTVEEFKARFRKGRQIKISPMHWGPFSRMSDEDLEALYLFLNSLEPVENDPGELIFKK